ncbi:PAS domain S-box protein [Geobacter pelophilus]|uniref:Oxygen sensor histidine kinase NreB n=1 Tax=Geoanaerobacter pelophilus TaxID=60036 RepID=A0AAW4L6Q0_9BACT|nr:PAS domain S-box protein [Geoanaerobacter pelophilus]MBT0666661.1 PAS domain S-box protein [Geoanaerobacter pelophilus]
MQYEKLTKAELIRILRDRDVAAAKPFLTSNTPHLPCGGSNSSSYHCLLNEFPALVWRSGIDGKCNFFNLNWLAFTGRTLEQELGDGWAEGVHPDDLEKCLSDYLSAFHARRSFDIEYRLRRYDGEYRWIHDVGRLLTVDGQFNGYVGICFDITETKKTDLMLQDKLEEISDLYHNAPCGYHSVDGDGYIVAINDTELSWLGYAREELVGHARLSDIMTPECRNGYVERFQTFKERGWIKDRELDLVCKDGNVITVLLNGSAVYDDNGNFKMCRSTLFDITERKRNERLILSHQEQLKLLADNLFHAEEMERKRISGDLHDMIGQSLILSKIRLKRLSEELEGRSAAALIDEIIKLTDESIQQVRSLIFQISPPLLYEVGLEAAVESLGERFYHEHGLEVNVRTRYASLSLSEGLRVTLYQVLRELLLNVVKHVDARQVSVVFDKSDSLTITVEDDGNGFNVEDVMSANKGSGYGLFNVRQKIERINGSIIIDSSLGRGTRVLLNVPL